MKYSIYWKTIKCPDCNDHYRAALKIRLSRYGHISLQVDHYGYKHGIKYYKYCCSLSRKEYPKLYKEAELFLVSKGYTLVLNNQHNLSVSFV